MFQALWYIGEWKQTLPSWILHSQDQPFPTGILSEESILSSPKDTFIGFREGGKGNILMDLIDSEKLQDIFE